MSYKVFIAVEPSDTKSVYYAGELMNSLARDGYETISNAHIRVDNEADFDDKLRSEIDACTDFIVIISANSVKKLVRQKGYGVYKLMINRAYKKSRNIIPVILDGVQLHKVKLIDAFKFLTDYSAIQLYNHYMASPMQLLVDQLSSKPGNDIYETTSNKSERLNIKHIYLETLNKAKEGNTEAMYQVGIMSFYGLASITDTESRFDFQKSHQMFTQLSETECELTSYANAYLGKMYYRGIVPDQPQSLRRSYEYQEKTDIGNSPALLEALIYMKTEGMGTDFDYDATVKFIEDNSANLTNAARNQVAEFFIKYGDVARAIIYLEQMSSKSPQAAYKLGQIYLSGMHEQPPRPDPYKAAFHFQIASEMGYLDAIFALAHLYFKGSFDFMPNLVKARQLYKLAADKGHWDAQYNYAWMAEYGLGGPQDIEDAIIYATKGANDGLTLCMAELAILYQYPEFRNYQKAFEWAKKAAEADDPFSKFMLANFYMFGRGCEPDEEMAVKYYNEAARDGVYEAQIMRDKFTDVSALMDSNMTDEAARDITSGWDKSAGYLIPPKEVLANFGIEKESFDACSKDVQIQITCGIVSVLRLGEDKTKSDEQKALDATNQFINFAKAFEQHLNDTLLKLLKEIYGNFKIDGKEYLNNCSRLTIGQFLHVLRAKQYGKQTFFAEASNFCNRHQSLKTYTKNWWAALAESIAKIPDTRNNMAHSGIVTEEDGYDMLKLIFAKPDITHKSLFDLCLEVQANTRRAKIY